MGRPPLPDGQLVAEIKAVIAESPPTYGYQRVHAILKRQALDQWLMSHPPAQSVEDGSSWSAAGFGDGSAI
jgi:hypothetical protein